MTSLSSITTVQRRLHLLQMTVELKDSSMRLYAWSHKNPPWVKRDIVLVCMCLLEILRKLSYNSSKFLNQMNLVAQAVGVGQDRYQPVWILYLDLARLDTYVSSLPQRWRCLLTCIKWGQLKEENLPALQERLNALDIDEGKYYSIRKTLRQWIHDWLPESEPL